MNTTVKFLAITDETTVCECCGKKNLKCVVVLELADGSIVRYGTDCASKAFRSSKVHFQSSVDIFAYVQKWLNKTPDYTLEVVAKGIQNKLGFNAKVENGKIYVKLTDWVAVS